MSYRAKQLRDRTSLSLSGNTGVWAKSSYVKLWRHIGSRRIWVMKKLDESKVKWIILQKQKGNHFQDCRDYECLHTLGQKALSQIQIHRSRQDRLSCPHGKAGGQHSRTQGVFCCASCQNRRSPRRRAPARNH